MGSKSAQRYAFHILRGSDEDAEELAGVIREIKAALRLCSVCNNITDMDCGVLLQSDPNQRMVCVVEEPTTLPPLEKETQLQWGLSRAAWQSVTDSRRGPRAPADRKAEPPRPSGPVDQVIRRDQSDGGGRGDCGVPGPSTEATGVRVT